MRQITKGQVIDLIRVMNMDGVDNEHSDIVIPVFTRDSRELFGGDYGFKLEPGAYCAIHSSEADLSDFPSVQRWINNSLKEENFEIIPNGDYSIFVICLELLG